MDGVGEMFGDVDGELDGEIVGEPAGDVDGIAVGLHVTSQPVFPQSAQMIALWQEERRGDVGPTTMECKTKAGNDEPPVTGGCLDRQPALTGGCPTDSRASRTSWRIASDAHARVVLYLRVSGILTSHQVIGVRQQEPGKRRRRMAGAAVLRVWPKPSCPLPLDHAAKKRHNFQRRRPALGVK